jgi:hypothetical protein
MTVRRGSLLTAYVILVSLTQFQLKIVWRSRTVRLLDFCVTLTLVIHLSRAISVGPGAVLAAVDYECYSLDERSIGR